MLPPADTPWPCGVLPNLPSVAGQAPLTRVRPRRDLRVRPIGTAAPPTGDCRTVGPPGATRAHHNLSSANLSLGGSKSCQCTKCAPRNAARRNVSSVICSPSLVLGILGGVAGQALAQDAAAKPDAAQDGEAVTRLDTVTVTGQRAALDKAVSVKQMEDHVVEVISADNMGQMPNVTVAEALARLPGVTASLDRGNASLATVRGLGPRMTMGTVNGREIASSEPDRAVRWEIFPTEIVSTVKVYKTPSA